jgi:hypothetical protein
MKKILLLLAVLTLLCTLSLFAKPTNKLTIKEKVNIKKLMLSDDPNWVQMVADSNDIAKAMLIDPVKVEKLKKYREKVIKGEKTCKRRVDGKWVTRIATLADANKALRFNWRWFYDDPNMIDKLLMHEICPLDGSPANPVTGSAE